nr:DnaD domain protein [uncultured Cellulosilyticum sp.]
MRKVLFDKSPLVVDTVLATYIGLNEAIVLQQVHYWIEINKAKDLNFYEDKYWTYNSMKEWGKSFPFYGDKTLKRIFNNLEKLGILKTGNFNKLRMDRTKWYTIDYERLEAYIDEKVAAENEAEKIACPEIEDKSGQNDPMQYPKKENARGQNDPMEEDNLTQCKGTKWPNAYRQNDPTNTRDFSKTSSENFSETSSSSFKQVVDFFQNNFYLPKAFEAEVLSDLIKCYDAELVLMAMKIARKNNARSLRYIEKVLVNWAEEGIRSIAVLESYLKAREEKQDGQKSRNHEQFDDKDVYAGLGLSLSDLQ